MSYTPASQLKLALGTSSPNPSDQTNWFGELSGAGYARQNIGFLKARGADAEFAEVRNDAPVDFPEASGNWGTVTHWALWDDSGTPNMLAYGEVCGGGVPIDNGEVIAFPVETLVMPIKQANYPLSMQRTVLDHVFRGDTWTAPSDIYVAAGTTPVHQGMEAAEIAEPSGGGYARTQQSNWSVSDSSASNVGNADFPNATSDWPNDIVSLALLDASSGGNLLAAVNLDSPVTVTSGNNLRVPSGEFVVRCGLIEEMEGPPPMP